MKIPDFPRFTEIDMSLMSDVKCFLKVGCLDASEYTFTNIFAFRSAYDFRLSVLEKNLIIISKEKPVSMFCPVGRNGVEEVMYEVFDYMRSYSDHPVMERVPEGFVNEYINNSSRFVADADRDNFDYIYNVKELIELKGRRFHDKKNKVNKFRNTYNYEYLSLTPDIVQECLEFEDHWCEVKECGKYPGLKKEKCAILEMLNNFESLKLKGGAIRIGGKIVALTIGERYLSDTFVIHVEKAQQAIDGLYQVINQEFLVNEASDCMFVNREQDLGLQNLRNTKMSYNPARYVEKYKVREKKG
jgi:hypothetical protein